MIISINYELQQLELICGEKKPIGLRLSSDPHIHRSVGGKICSLGPTNNE